MAKRVRDLLATPRTAQPALRLNTDLKALADAANEAAKRAAAQWLYFATVMITLAAIVGSTTHRDLLLESSVKVPLLSIELPLLSFYLATPAIFVTLHFYMLVQLRLMAEKVSAFVAAVEKESRGNPTTRALALNQIDSFFGPQLPALP